MRPTGRQAERRQGICPGPRAAATQPTGRGQIPQRKRQTTVGKAVKVTPVQISMIGNTNNGTLGLTNRLPTEDARQRARKASARPKPCRTAGIPAVVCTRVQPNNHQSSPDKALGAEQLNSCLLATFALCASECPFLDSNYRIVFKFK